MNINDIEKSEKELRVSQELRELRIAASVFGGFGGSIITVVCVLVSVIYFI